MCVLLLSWRNDVPHQGAFDSCHHYLFIFCARWGGGGLNVFVFVYTWPCIQYHVVIVLTETPGWNSFCFGTSVSPFRLKEAVQCEEGRGR